MEYSLLALSSPPAPAADAHRPAPSHAGLSALIDRMAEVVEEETRAIGRDPGFDLKASNARKSRCLYEFSRAAKGMRENELAADHLERLRRLRGLLARNEAAVRAHLLAVGEVASLLQGVIERSQSDGTYGAGGWDKAPQAWGEF